MNAFSTTKNSPYNRYLSIIKGDNTYAHSIHPSACYSINIS